MPADPSQLKSTFRAAQPVSYRWYNLVAKLLKQGTAVQDSLKSLPGYDASEIQVLVNDNGALRWSTVNQYDS